VPVGPSTRATTILRSALAIAIASCATIARPAPVPSDPAGTPTPVSDSAARVTALVDGLLDDAPERVTSVVRRFGQQPGRSRVR
jgi:hypothetical protein